MHFKHIVFNKDVSINFSTKFKMATEKVENSMIDFNFNDFYFYNAI